MTPTPDSNATDLGPSASHLDSGVLSKQLTQVLEHLKRSGISSIPAAKIEDLPPEARLAIESADSNAQATPGRPPSQNAAATGSDGHTTTAVAALSTAASDSSASPPAAEPKAGKPAGTGQAPPATVAPKTVAPATWELPILPLADREAALGAIDAEVKDCRECSEIVAFRRQTVLGEGSLDARICFIGEAPGADEDRTGRPFVGKAGQLLTKIIKAMKLEREDVYILNGLKCRPPQNRTPVATEIENCRGFAQRQLETIKPEFIVCLGAVAVRSLLGMEQSIGRLRGRFHTYRGAKVIVTYHPSYLLRNESAKRLVWEDMKMLMAELEADGSS